MSYPTKAERQASEHRDEWSYGWQYATVFRQVRDLDTEQKRDAVRRGGPPSFFKPPEGDGWEINTDKHRHVTPPGRTHVTPPDWCKDGTVLTQRLYWRRPRPGMQPWQKEAHLSFCRDSDA